MTEKKITSIEIRGAGTRDTHTRARGRMVLQCRKCGWQVCTEPRPSGGKA